MSPYPYPHDVLVNTRHSWVQLMEKISHLSTSMHAFVFYRLLLAPLGAEQAEKRADELTAAAEHQWATDHHAAVFTTLVEQTAQELLDTLTVAGKALTRQLGMTSAASAVGAPTPSAPSSSVHGEQSAAADGEAGLPLHRSASHPILAEGVSAGVDTGRSAPARGKCGKPMHKACRCVRPTRHDGPCNCAYPDGSPTPISDSTGSRQPASSSPAGGTGPATGAGPVPREEKP